MVREYGLGRSPLPDRFAWKSTYGTSPRVPAGSSSSGLRRSEMAR